MESIIPTTSAKEGNDKTKRNKQPFNRGTEPSRNKSTDTKPLSTEDSSYINFGYRAPTEKKKDEAPVTQNVQNPMNQLNPDGSNRQDFNRAAFGERSEASKQENTRVEEYPTMGKYNRSIYDKTPTQSDPMNQLNPDGSNREEFNYAAFAYRDPKSKQPSENKPSIETPPVTPQPEETKTPIAETQEDQRGSELTQENPEARIEDINLDIAIGQLTEQERKEIIRERQRTAEDMAQEEAMTGNWFQRKWKEAKFSFGKNYEKFRMLDTLKGLPAEEIFANDRNEFRKRSDQRAEELASLMAENEFTKISKNKGFEGEQI
jgi:hypothetical protein